MLKKILDLLFQLITNPAKTWKALSGELHVTNEFFFKSYLYPLFGTVALLAFVGIFFTEKEFDFQLALKTAINNLITVFAGFYLAAFLLRRVIEHFLGEVAQTDLCERFVGYASAPVYIYYMISSIFPDDFFFLRLFVLYSVYIIWEGASPFMGVREEKKLDFTLYASAIILITPFLIEKITFMLMPGLRV